MTCSGTITLILERRADTWEARLLRDHRSQLETIPHVTEDRATLNFNQGRANQTIPLRSDVNQNPVPFRRRHHVCSIAHSRLIPRSATCRIEPLGDIQCGGLREDQHVESLTAFLRIGAR